jgi:hypothetical protein
MTRKEKKEEALRLKAEIDARKKMDLPRITQLKRGGR